MIGLAKIEHPYVLPAGRDGNGEAVATSLLENVDISFTDATTASRIGTTQTAYSLTSAATEARGPQQDPLGQGISSPRDHQVPPSMLPSIAKGVSKTPLVARRVCDRSRKFDEGCTRRHSRWS